MKALQELKREVENMEGTRLHFTGLNPKAIYIDGRKVVSMIEKKIKKGRTKLLREG